MTRKLFALLALVGLTALPSTGWAKDYYATVTAIASPAGGGNVYVSTKGGNTGWLPDEATYTYGAAGFLGTSILAFTINAQESDGYSFRYWSESPDGSSKKASKEWDFTVTTTSSSKPGVQQIYYAIFHKHDYGYRNDGADKIVCFCQNSDKHCEGIGEKTATLVAEPSYTPGTEYAGARVDYEDGFVGTPEITYWQGDTQLPGAPSEIGEYMAKITIGGVTAEKGFIIAAEEHVHSYVFDATTDGAQLRAHCTAESSCDARDLAIVLEIESGDYDGKQHEAKLTGTEAFAKSVENTVVGPVTYNGSETAPKYTGAYTASCTVTIDGTPYTISKAFNITKPAGGYSDGYEVDSTGVRYDTWGEALAAANDGDTIYYRDGSKDQSDPYDFTSDKNVTVDLGGATLKQTKKSGAMYIGNSGVGTVTLVNGTIHQPKYGWSNAEDVRFTGADNGGKFVLGADLKMTNEANDHRNSMTIYGDNVGVEIVAGQYQIVGLGSGVLVSGGQFWSEFSPDASHLAANRIVRTISGDYPNEVVEHTHHIFYSAAGNVITASCDTNNHEYCGFGAPTVTLTAENARTTGEAYTGAHVDVTAGFPVEVTDADITYWQGEQQLGGAPIETGDYIAKVEAGGVMAEKAFQITHEHVFKFDAEGDTLTATCTAQGVCDAKTLTLTLVAEDRDWKKATAFAASVTDGFGETIAYTPGEYVYYKRGEEKPLAGAPILTGEYTAKVTVTIAAAGETAERSETAEGRGSTEYTLTKDFAITKPENGYTSGYEVKDGLCYDTFADAVAAASAGATIYWHDGGDTISDKTFNFNSANDITVDLCGKSFSQSSDSIRLSNSKAGVVTLTNGKVVQTGYTHNIQITGGKIVFGDDLSVYLANKSLEVADGASLQIVGGKYSQDAKPDDYIEGLGDDYVILPISETYYKYQVVPHAHKLTYSASANVITVVCTNENAAYCNYKPNNGEKLTLTAEDRQETGGAYEGAQVEYSTKFPVKDAEIEYWVKNGEKLEGAPSAVGFYEARVTVGEATAVAPFEITHIHEFELQVVDGTNVTARCTVSGGSCDYQEAKTVTLLAADEKIFDGAAYEATSTKEAGFPSEDLVTVAIEYWVKNGAKLESAPSDVGAYTVKMIVTSSRTAAPIVADPSGAFGVGYVSAAAEKDFVIVQADLANATIELNKENYAFNGQAQENGIKTVKLGNYTLVEGTDYTKSGDDFSQVGSPSTDCTYTVTFTPCGNFSGSPVERSWTISAPTGEMGKLEEVKGEGQTALAGELEGTTLTVTMPTNLCFLGRAWYAGLSVKVPNSVDWSSSANSSGTNTNDLRLAFSHVGDLSHVDGNSYTWALSQKTIDYATSITWFAQFTLDEIAAAIGKGDTEIVRTMTVSAVPGTFNKAGIREVVYTIKLPLEDLVLPVPAEKTLAAGDVAIDGFKLQLGKKAVVTANAQVTDFAVKIVSDGTAGYAVTESGEEPYTYKNAAVSYQITYQFEGNDGKTPTHTNPTTYTVADSVTFVNATLEGYEFKGWNPASIAAGTTGDQTVIGTFEKIAPPTITITIAKDTGVADVQTNGVSVVGALELPADATTVELTLVKDTALVIPVYKVITNDVTNVTQRIATHAVVEGLTYTFIAEEAKADDPGVSDADVKEAIIAAVDPSESHDAAVANIEAVIGGDEPKVAPKELATWITDNGIKSVDIAASDYLAASVKLDTPKPITDATEVKVETFENASAEGFELSIAIKIDSEATPEVVKAAKEKVVGYIQAVEELGNEFAPVDAERVTIDTATGKVTITPAEGKTSEFFKIVIPKDK